MNADLYLRKSIDLGISDPYYSDAVNLYSKAKVLTEIINNPVPFTPKSVSGISTEREYVCCVFSPYYDPNLIKDKEKLNFIPKRTIENAVEDLCEAFRQNKFKNTFSEDIYFNINRMKNINAK